MHKHGVSSMVFMEGEIVLARYSHHVKYYNFVKFHQSITACFIHFRAASNFLTGSYSREYFEATRCRKSMLDCWKHSIQQGACGEESLVHPWSRSSSDCPLSPVIYNCAIAQIMHCALNNHRGIQIGHNCWISVSFSLHNHKFYSNVPSQHHLLKEKKESAIMKIDCRIVSWRSKQKGVSSARTLRTATLSHIT